MHGLELPHDGRVVPGHDDRVRPCGQGAVKTAQVQVVLASDSIHSYEEMALDRPFWLFCDLEGMYRGYELLRTLETRPGTVVAGHDPAVMTMFESVQDECVDLTRRVA